MDNPNKIRRDIKAYLMPIRSALGFNCPHMADNNVHELSSKLWAKGSFRRTYDDTIWLDTWADILNVAVEILGED